MKVVQINHFSYKAAGSIMFNLHKAMLSQGIESYVAWGRGRKAENKHEYYMNDETGVKIHALYTRLTDRTGFASTKSTRILIAWLEGIKPDIVHLHCIHGYYINIKLLFEYLRSKSIKVIWTQHDCWAFTGHCAYFDAAGCDKWITGCEKCGQLKTYPKSITDSSKENWDDKKRLFTGLNATLVTPCNWLENMIKRSFLNEYPVSVIYNGIDTNVFHRVKSDFKEKNKIGADKKVILGVASEWTERKGLRDFIKLEEMINNHWKIVLVGLSKKQLKEIPAGIIGIERTNNVSELVEIYSSADVFFNPTYEDNFPTTNIEAIACGTPVITYKTGGCPEAVKSNDGFVVDKGGLQEVVDVLTSKQLLRIDTGLDKQFTKENMIKEYLRLYSQI